MKSKALQRVLDSTPKDIEIFTDLYGDLLVRINEVLRKKGITQKALANKLDKSPSEISKWLSGEHNFTLRSLAKLSAELDEVLLVVPKSNEMQDAISNYSSGKWASGSSSACAKVIYMPVVSDVQISDSTQLSNVG